jgi:asparagine synthetase B (glutamine-hydrolysing)
MCSIIGSFHKDKIHELIELNAYRGQHSWSISYYDCIWDYMKSIKRGMGEIPKDLINIGLNEYCIVHMQAPTTSNKDLDTVHPAEIDESHLWHNGIIKAEWVNAREKGAWDTHLILKQYLDTKDLNDIDGTFACLMHDRDRLYLFRNEISPLFIDKYSNISSTKFEDSHMISPNKLFRFTPGDATLKEVGSFNTVNNPYYGLNL